MTIFLSDPGKPGIRSFGPDVREWVSEQRLWDFNDVTLADEDTNSILTDNANRAIQGNVAMQVTQDTPSRYLVAKFGTDASCAIWWPNLQLKQSVVKFATYASGAIWWSNLQLMQMVSSGGQICY